MPADKSADTRKKRKPAQPQEPDLGQISHQVEEIARERFAPLVEKHGVIELPARKDSWNTRYYYQIAPDRAVQVWIDYREEHVYVALVKLTDGKPPRVPGFPPSKQHEEIGVYHFLTDIAKIQDAWLEDVGQTIERWATTPRITLRRADEMLTTDAEMVDRYFDNIVHQPEEVLFPVRWQPGQIKQTREVVSFTMSSDEMDQVRKELTRLGPGASIAGWVQEAIREKLERSKEKA